MGRNILKQLVSVVLPFGIAILSVIAGYYFYTHKEDSIVRIDKTKNVVSEIKKLSQLTTMCYYEEFVLHKKKANAVADNSIGRKLSEWICSDGESIIEDEIVIIAKGRVSAGYDLSKVQDTDIVISNDTIQIALPEVQLLDVTINPSGFDFYVENGTWSHEEVVAIECEGKGVLEQSAIKNGVLEKAEENGREKISSLLKTFGFSSVIIR